LARAVPATNATSPVINPAELAASIQTPAPSIPGPVPPASAPIAGLPPPADPLRRGLVTECDRLAASPLDPQRPNGVSGVGAGRIDIVPALAACNEAVRRYPDVTRFVYHLGRITDQQKDYARARELYERAAAAGSAVSMNNLGVLYGNGRGVNRDYTEARRWY